MATEQREADGGRGRQRNYWERIIRSEPELERIRGYICDNPARWELDRLHPEQPAFGAGGAFVGETRVPDRAGLRPAPTKGGVGALDREAGWMETRRTVDQADGGQRAGRRRRSIRLKGYDYAQAGAYFVTVCTQEPACLFGDVVDGEVVLSDAGRIVQRAWDALPNHYPHADLDAWIIMPNHVHAVIVLGAGVGADVGAGLRPARAEAARHGLAEIVRALKSFSSRRINELRGTGGVTVWQRNYWERVIRNEPELERIRGYICDNPARWELDRLHPEQPASGAGGAFVGETRFPDRAGLRPAPTKGGPGARTGRQVGWRRDGPLIRRTADNGQGVDGDRFV